MYYLERTSLYIDIHYIYYGRYIDDGASVAKDEETALAQMKAIEEADEDGKIRWEVDFPQNEEDYIPFLNSEVRIQPDGTISSRLYRKPTKKWITIHQNSHQPENVKVNTIRNSYREARKISSGPEELKHSLKIVDNLYKKNGFSHPRQHDIQPRMTNNPTSSSPKNSKPSLVTLTIDFVSQDLSNKIRNEVKRLDLPIRINFVSSVKLRNKLCSSRPYDKRVCRFNNCNICPNIVTKNKDCSVKNIVYRIECNICKQFYIGETMRTAHERLTEHLRYAKFPTTTSNLDKAWAIHYKSEHPGITPDLSFDILLIEPQTVRRKIFEAMYINDFKPTLNLKDELKTVHRFLTHRARV